MLQPHQFRVQGMPPFGDAPHLGGSMAFGLSQDDVRGISGQIMESWNHGTFRSCRRDLILDDSVGCVIGLRMEGYQ